MPFALSPVLDRYHRHVRCLRLRTPDSAHQLALTSMVEEALRIATLPGEDQGRIYFFRTMRLPAFNPRGPRAAWIARIAAEFRLVGADAVHALELRAESARAVFFDHASEPFIELLAALAAGAECRQWLWQRSTGVPVQLPPQARAAAVVDSWRIQAGGWTPVAREAMPLAARIGIRRFLGMIPHSVAEEWIAQLGPEQSGLPPRITLRPASREMLLRASIALAPTDARVEWLAMLALLEATPALQQNSGLRREARRHLEHQRINALPSRREELKRELPPLEIPATTQHVQKEIIGETVAEAAVTIPDSTAPASARKRRDGLATDHAGLYFLVNPLLRLGIAQVLEDHPELAQTHFCERLLIRLAMRARVPADDPILAPLLAAINGFEHACDPLVSPANMAHLRHLRQSSQTMERLWCAGVRLWCREHAKLTIGTIIRRPGRVFTTANSLDLTLPMSAVAIAIRRCGLDLDPGYVPWLDCVVRFHYGEEER